jgi:hypothetical protein
MSFVSIDWFKEQIKQGRVTVWRYEHLQSGDVRYTVMEPERYEREMNYIREVDALEQLALPSDILADLAEEFVEY